MKYKIKALALLIFIVGVFTFACQNNKSAIDTNSSVDKQTYQAVGVIKNIDLNTGKVIIDHEAIPGYQSAMQMNEAVSDKSLLASLKSGDKVEFEIERTSDKIVITKINKIGDVTLINGSEIYQTNCAECHGATGEGAKKGIPLISGHALHHTEEEYIDQVKNGEGKKMPAFKDKLSGEQIVAVVKFVREELQKSARSAARPETKSMGH